MAKERDYGREYADRVRRNRGLPKSVARGHGALPARVARELEAGGREGLSRDVRRQYSAEIRAYEKEFGPAGKGRAGRERRIPRTFKTKADAEAWAEDAGIPGPYLRITGARGAWSITVLR